MKRVTGEHGEAESSTKTPRLIDKEAAIGEIDNAQYNRQLRVHGRDDLHKLKAYKVLISGLGGLGAEIAKNLILAGVKSVTLHDEDNVELWDLSSNFTFSQEDVGQNRALASVSKLQELNKSVVISTITCDLRKEDLSEFQAVVFTDIILERAMKFDDFCHQYQPPIAFIRAEVRGVFGRIFSDFGPGFEVIDDGKGEGKQLDFNTLRQSHESPGELLMCDLSNFERTNFIHEAFEALDKFRLDFRRFPLDEDVEQLADFFDDETNVDKTLLRIFARGSRATLSPMASIFGGIVGYEVLKSCTHKLHPIFQFFYFDSVESLSSEPLESSDFEPLNCRNDAQISVFGLTLQKKLEEANVFVVGSGASGCEFLKNLALMGVCCGGGKITITDHDVIKSSNLSGQFLFRDSDTGQAKSKAAASAASLINPRLQCRTFQYLASPRTEHVFDDNFWENLSVVISALDNVKARLYIDRRCVYFKKALLESATVGTKCITHMVIPYLTENYGASHDSREEEARTIHSTPYNIDHCLTWAMSEVEGFLVKIPTEVNDFLSHQNQYISTMMKADLEEAQEILQHVLQVLKDIPQTFKDCLSWARLRFEENFSYRVQQLTSDFPEGSSFWSAPKSFPHPLQFTTNDLSHLEFVMLASKLRAKSFCIPIPDWADCMDLFAIEVNKIAVPDFQLKPVVDEEIVTDFDAIRGLGVKLAERRMVLPGFFRMKAIQVDKDVDTMIAVFANLRARNYDIPEVAKDVLKNFKRQRAPPLAPAISITAGLVCLELYKIIDGGHKKEDYRNTSVDLAAARVSIAEPASPKSTNHHSFNWTIWDRWIIGAETLSDVLEFLQGKELTASRISLGNSTLYDKMFPDQEKLVKKITHLADEMKLTSKKYIDVGVSYDGMELNVPQISIRREVVEILMEKKLTRGDLVGNKLKLPAKQAMQVFDEDAFFDGKGKFLRDILVCYDGSEFEWKVTRWDKSSGASAFTVTTGWTEFRRVLNG